MERPELVEQLNDMSTRQLVRWLTTPAQCGFYLSRDDLARLGRQVEVTVTPFGRPSALEQLLRGAAVDSKLEEMLAALRSEMERQLTAYRELDLPALTPWIERGKATLAAWSAIERAFAGERGDDR